MCRRGRAVRAGGRAPLIAGAPLLVAALLASEPARGDGTEPIRIQVSAPEGCAGTDAFIAEVSARTARARLAGAGEVARSFTVTIVAAGKRARGTLVIEDPHGAGGHREVSGESCAEVASALALVTALAIDPKASTAAKVVPRPPPPPPSPPPSLPPPTPPPPRIPQRPPPLTALPWWGPVGGPLPAFPMAPPGPRWRWSAVLRVGAASAIAPSVVPVLSGAIELARLDGLLSPALRLAYVQADSGAQVVGLGPQRARFALLAGRLEVCPVRAVIHGPISAAPCALFEAGALAADGLSPFSPSTRTRPWAAPGLGARVQIDVLGDAMVEVDGGAVFPLVRDEFYFSPTLTAHVVPTVGGFVGGGVGMHFP